MFFSIICFFLFLEQYHKEKSREVISLSGYQSLGPSRPVSCSGMQWSKSRMTGMRKILVVLQIALSAVFRIYCVEKQYNSYIFL